jgi:protein TonB
MFEDALMESGGKLHTQRGWFSGVAAMCNGSIVCLLLLWPLMHPASLPRQTMSTLLAVPLPPAPQVIQTVHAPVAASRAVVNPFTAPQRIPNQIRSADDASLEVHTGTPIPGLSTSSLNGLPDSIGTSMPPQVRLESPRKLAISSGVMEGRRLSGADPRYPAIAVAARIQGTVVLAATISKNGAIENLRVMSGPPMLVAAAVDAVRNWRYRPYLLNGEPVEVETTVRVIFNLGG